MAGFDRVLMYKVGAKAVLPFRTGGSEKKDELLVDEKNRPYIQANSISGAFGEYAKLHFGRQKDKLFGSQADKSLIVFSDGIISNSYPERRPGVKIDGKTGTAARGSLFSMDFIAAGFGLEFEIRVFEKENDNYRAMAEEMLSAFNNGEILLGGQKTKGCGRFKITSLQRCILDMHNSADMDSWLNDSFTYEDITAALLNKEEKDFYDISMKGEIVNSLIVKSSDSEGSNCESIKTKGRYYVPGSSIKGVVRHRITRIADYRKIKKDFEEYIFGRESRGDNDNGIKGKIIFEDALIEHDDPSKMKKTMHRIHIDKLTGSVMGSAKFNETVVTGSLDIHVKVSKNIEIDKADRSKEAAALVMLALRDIGCGAAGLGGLASVGRGFIKADKILIDGVENTDFINDCIQKLNDLCKGEGQ